MAPACRWAHRPTLPTRSATFWTWNGSAPRAASNWAIRPGAVSVDDLVYSAAGGLVGDLATAGHGTFWVIGRAIKTVGAANLEISYIPCFPYQATQ